MHHKKSSKIRLSTQFAWLLVIFRIANSFAQVTTNMIVPTLEIQADHITAKMPPTFYGLMTEEINYSYEGGLYGELIRNRSFKADAIQEPIKPENYDPAK